VLLNPPVMGIVTVSAVEKTFPTLLGVTVTASRLNLKINREVHARRYAVGRSEGEGRRWIFI
jgi:hypothetical protein